ncbi:DUF6188 family protein [Nocardia jinanensis]|uniref:Uncharacterized protein n=1 Tax=Nocardia jinanensis TaxID=382504 RepID=A0A917VXD8_9NOCA|nr:DUF6188 family protein [Nocardia jinanensis]GGL27945.1 hypothetical protein GCM10011588_48450 [Nocardia jinanensis]
MIVPTPAHPVQLVQLTPVLVLRAGADFEVQIESEVGIETADRVTHRYLVGAIPENIGPQLTGLLRDAQVTADGTLRLEFDSGSSIEAFSDADYEAWSVVGANGYRVVCMPGGELAVWSTGE